MADTVFVRVGGASEAWQAIVVDAQGRIVQQAAPTPPDALVSLVEGRRLVALLPGSEVVTTEADLPPGSPARLRQMLPYSLEETFAEDVDRLLFAAGKRLEQGGLAVSVIAKHTLDARLEGLVEAGVKIDAVYAETDGVPDTPSTLNLLLEGERIYGRRPGRAAFYFEGLGLAQVYGLLGGEDGDGVGQHVAVFADEAAQVLHEHDIAELRARTASLELRSFARGALPHLAAGLATAPGTNLLQGPYAPRSDWRALARPWHAAASLLGAAILVAVIAEAGEYWALAREDAVLTERLMARCNEFAATTRLSACAATVQRRLSDAGAESSTAGETFLSTLSTVAQFRPGDSLIEGLSYRNEVMDLQLVAASVPSLDTFAQQIVDTERFVARIQSANQGEDGVEGRIQVVGADD